MQSVKPDAVVLWVAFGDYDKLPEDVMQLQKHGLTINQCEDIRSYKKLVPQFIERPDAAIVTADDDVYYHKSWLEELTDSVDLETKEVLCHRAHLIAYNRADHQVSPYNTWQFETDSTLPSRFIFPTGVGGILYMPGVLHADVVIADQFMALCPTNDDIWFYFMAALNGAIFRKVGPRRTQILWDGSQEVSLWSENQMSTGNDKMISMMVSRFGDPWVDPE